MAIESTFAWMGECPSDVKLPLMPASRAFDLRRLALAVTSLVAAAFYGWVTYGSSILLTLAETGLSNCF